MHQRISLYLFCFQVCFHTDALKCYFLSLLIPISRFRDLRRPENVSVDSLNTRYVLRWDWPHETAANQTVTFTAQYLRNEKYWTSVCVNVLEHRCDFTGAIHYKISFLLRVWANTSQQSSGWVQISFCPDEHAALGPPSSLKLSSVKGDLEIIITDPLSSTNQSMKTLLNDRLSYRIQYWRRSEEPQKAKDLETKNNLVMLTELDRQTWYCVRVQSRDGSHKKSSVFSDTHCTRTEGQMPYWQIFLYFLISLLLSFLLVLLNFCFYKMITLLKNTFCPAIQLPDHIQEVQNIYTPLPNLGANPFKPLKTNNCLYLILNLTGSQWSDVNTGDIVAYCTSLSQSEA
uniref:Interferon alpha/beta receptor 1a-like n=1 Tax=Sinocyclocheilus rhinocerous TaxID=307959 RepID=A0A673IC81_9TELE